MSFQSSARTVRDLSRPLGHRVSALHQCVESFSPFGFQATRLQLRRVLHVTSAGWTDEQLLHGIALLEQARRSWIAARDGADVRTYQPENRVNRPLPEGGVPFTVWLATYLGEEANAERWGVAHIGPCTACGHLLVVHRRWGCLACVVEAGAHWDQSCQVRSPLEPFVHVDPQSVSDGAWRWMRSLLEDWRHRRLQRRP